MKAPHPGTATRAQNDFSEVRKKSSSVVSGGHGVKACKLVTGVAEVSRVPYSKAGSLAFSIQAMELLRMAGTREVIRKT